MCKLLHIRLGGILAQSTQALANLLLLDLAITTIVEQVEGFLEFCWPKETFVEIALTIKRQA